MKCILAIFVATLAIVGQTPMAFSQQPMSKGSWSYKNGKPETANFDYGTKLTAEDIRRLSAFDSIAHMYMGYAGVDSEYVTIEGDLLKLGRLKNLEVVFLNKDGIVDDDLKFIPQLPRIHELEFNAKNGEVGCTDRCADYLSSAKTLRELRIYNGQFTDKFIDKITKGMPNLEQLMLSSPELTDESLRFIAERCKNLKSLSIGSDHFTAEGLKHLDKLPNLNERGVSSPYFWWKAVAEDWLRQAESACHEIEDEDAADHAFARLQAIYIQWGEIAKAEKIAKRIKNREQRARAHLAIARHYAEAGNEARCKLQLNLVKPLAVKSRLRDELVEACLQLAKFPPLAISFIIEEHNDPKARESLCEALARHGHLDEALTIAEDEKDARQQLTFKVKTAVAAAKAARIEDTERAVQHVLASDAYKGDAQGIWCELAEALYEKGEMEAARKYAARVTNKYTIATHRDLRRIMKGVPSDVPYVSTPRSDESDTLNAEFQQTDNPEEAKRMVEAAIANAEQNPIESTTGQFGPWNQTAQLAKLRLGYAYVAALYRKAGNQERATKATEIAEEAIQTLVKENGFIAMLLLGDLYRMQISTSDIDGLKRSTAVTDPRLWLTSADPIVSKVLLSGDVDGAKNIAKRALSARTGFGKLPGSDRSELISCFIEAGETHDAHELVKASELAGLTAAACEDAGRVMVETKRWQLLGTSKWRNGIGAFQRAHLCIGAALMAKKTSKAN